MMRVALSLFLMLLLPIGADAKEPKINRIDVFEYGIYTADINSRVAAPDAAVGYRNVVTNVRNAAKTRTIPAQKGIQFGFRYKIVGSPRGKEVLFHVVTIFPPPGLSDPDTHQLKAKSEYDVVKVIGEETFKSYNFEKDWEVLPGEWTMQIWYGGVMLQEQKFNVVKQ
jgi:Domain of unknown function (DUF3859)